MNSISRAVESITIVLSLLFTEFIVHINGLANCPNGCQCDDDTLVVKCGEGTLDVLPIALNPSIQHLIIKNNKIKTIDSSIQFYAELTFLDLSYNELITIPPRTFAYQRKLQELHLNYNKIGQINNKIFVGLYSVMVLNMRGNLLSELEQDTFMPLEKIEELNLGQNRISHIDPRAFDGMKNLRVLYLDDNTLTTVPAATTFQSMPNLAELYLGTNAFVTIPPFSLQNLKDLTLLNLRGAGLYNISNEALKGLEGLRHLDISDNGLQQVPTQALLHLDRLEELYMGQNDFDTISAGAFAGLKNLRRLDITGAPHLRSIENGAFEANSNLESLNLSKNKLLSRIQEHALDGLPRLRHVILRQNHLSALAEGLFSWRDLQTLDVSENPFICDCQVLWLRNLLVLKNASFEEFSNIVCNAPEHLRGQQLNQLSAALLGCTHNDPKQQAMLGVLMVFIAATVSALVLFLYACRHRIRNLLKGGWGNSALCRKEREYQKTFSEEECIARQQQHPCNLSIQAAAPYPGGNYVQSHYMESLPIPVTEL